MSTLSSFGVSRTRWLGNELYGVTKATAGGHVNLHCIFSAFTREHDPSDVFPVVIVNVQGYGSRRFFDRKANRSNIRLVSSPA